MPNIYAQADYTNYLLIVDDTYSVGGQYVFTDLDNIAYAIADYPHWQVLTLSTLYYADTTNLARVMSSYTIRLTRPIVLIDKTTINTFASGVFQDSVRFPFYENTSDAFIKPEDGIESPADFSRDPNSVKTSESCKD